MPSDAVSRQENQKLADDQAAKMKLPQASAGTKLRAAVSERRSLTPNNIAMEVNTRRTLSGVAAAVGLMVLAQNALNPISLRKRNNSTAT